MERNRHANPNCPKCKGKGSIYQYDADTNTEEFKECVCVYRSMIVSKLKRIHPDLLSCGSDIDRTSLFDMRDDDGNIKNLVVMGDYNQVLRHIRKFLIQTYTNIDIEFNCRFIDDLDVTNKRFSHNRAEGEDEFLDSLKIPDLLVILADRVHHKNSLLPDYFLEALKKRPRMHGTWVYLPRPLSNRNHFFSTELREHLYKYFEEYKITSTMAVVKNEETGEVMETNSGSANVKKVISKSSILDGCPDV